MSEGPRIKAERAQLAAEWLMRAWSMGPGCLIVGSLRRGEELVGDIDLVAPLPTSLDDGLYHNIKDTVGDETAGLYEAAGARKRVGIAIKGLKAHFKECQLRVRLQGSKSDGIEPAFIGVNIWRYAPENKGWTIIRTTGPRDFGRWFLIRWAERWQLRGDASVGGMLVDSYGRKVPTESEEEAFTLCGLKWVDPATRELVAQRALAGRRAV